MQGQEKIAALCDSVTCDSVTQCVTQCNIFLIFFNIGKVVKSNVFLSPFVTLCDTHCAFDQVLRDTSQTCAVQQGSLLDISVMRRLGKLILK